MKYLIILLVAFSIMACENKDDECRGDSRLMGFWTSQIELEDNTIKYRSYKFSCEEYKYNYRREQYVNDEWVVQATFNEKGQYRVYNGKWENVEVVDLLCMRDDYECPEKLDWWLYGSYNSPNKINWSVSEDGQILYLKNNRFIKTK